ncbi:MAG: YggS family pyridoxal phosphate-dependent enzyme [Treponema sp.]|nr:YggS family pyridoxal phosphate-dependent enzyme [Treponema sp.]
MSVADNLAKIEERIQKTCNSTGRKRDEITLMGVSKFVPVSLINEAFKAGVRCFGESRVKEAAEKFEIFKCENEQRSFRLISPGFSSAEIPGTQLHMVGSLQRNKVKQAALLFDCVQSVDRNELIAELVKHSLLRDEPLKVLLELHTGEGTKSGYENLDALFKAAELLLSCDKLKPAGLMTMAPYTKDTDLIRSSFKMLVKAREELKKRFPSKENWECLSMGMSNDFDIAIEEGSTLLRIGSAIFND